MLRFPASFRTNTSPNHEFWPGSGGAFGIAKPFPSIRTQWLPPMITHSRGLKSLPPVEKIPRDPKGDPGSFSSRIIFWWFALIIFCIFKFRDIPLTKPSHGCHGSPPFWGFPNRIPVFLIYTWRIVAVINWLITMVSKSAK